MGAIGGWIRFVFTRAMRIGSPRAKSSGSGPAPCMVVVDDAHLRDCPAIIFRTSVLSNWFSLVDRQAFLFGKLRGTIPVRARHVRKGRPHGDLPYLQRDIRLHRPGAWRLHAVHPADPA